jgi:hypothetical protein
MVVTMKVVENKELKMVWIVILKYIILPKLVSRKENDVGENDNDYNESDT